MKDCDMEPNGLNTLCWNENSKKFNRLAKPVNFNHTNKLKIFEENLSIILFVIFLSTKKAIL